MTFWSLVKSLVVPDEMKQYVLWRLESFVLAGVLVPMNFYFLVLHLTVCCIIQSREY